ncbi:probable GPI-anchored adhesin-like protein PGA18 [Homarus americanus]|uniref:probable GPI-anchored adhesin-like protein PGA18 n=1 Tax=Homarus americanus TaxID=6706 RepID=UPI001C459685|nr:probable GPI-anchored adhesin-like protein PGA18 [Homarus americanus]
MTSRLIIVSLLLLESLTQAQIHGGTTVDGEALAADVTTPGPGSDSSPGPGLDTTPGSGLDTTPGSGLDTTPGSGLDTASGPGSDPAPGPVSEHSIAVTSMPNSEGNETMTTSEISTVTTTERSRDTSDTSLASEAATVTPAIDTDDRQLDATTTQETVLLNVGSEIDTNDISSPSPHSSTIEPAVGDEEVEREPSFAVVSTPSSSLNTINQEANTLPLDEEHSTEASLPDSSPEPVPDEDMTSLNNSI